MVGALVVFLTSLVSVGASMFGYPVPGLALAVSSMFALLMCGMILWQTSEIIHGGEANYIRRALSGLRRLAHRLGQVFGERFHQACVFAFHHYAQQRFGAGGAQQHASARVQSGFGFLQGVLHGL